MQKRKYSILAGAVLAASPLMAKATVFTFTYDSGDISFLPDSTGGTDGSGVGTYVAATNTISVSPGTQILIGADVSVSSNPNSTAAYHGVYDSAASGHHFIQPANLGISAFGFGFNLSNPSIAAFDAADGGSIGINGIFTGPTGAGVLSGGTAAANPNALGYTTYSGNIQANSISGGNITASTNTASTAGTAQLGYGNPGPSELFNTVTIDAGTALGSETLTPLTTAANEGYVTYNSGGTSTTSKPVYKAVTATGTDTITNLPALTIIVAGTATTPTGSTNKIINLTGTSLQGGTYGSQLGHAISISGSNNGYTVGNTGQVADPGQTTAFTSVATFSPGTDKEVYALKLDQGGTGIATTNTTLLTAIVADINASNSGNITASLVTGVYTSLFGGYDVLLTAPVGVGSTAYLGVDFSADTTDAGVSVTEIAAVPEPATAAGVVLGAAGLLLGRRKSRATVA